MFSQNPTNFSSLEATPLTECIKLDCPLFDKYQVQVWMKLDYQNHPQIQGNKWHKLRYNLAYAKAHGYKTLLTFGGAYSNHIAATAMAAKEAGMQSIGIIRGQELAEMPEKWSHTLQTAKKNGMRFEFIDRQSYRARNTAKFLDQLRLKHPDAYLLPEGGTNLLALKGFDLLAKQIQQQCPQWTHLYCAVGTGGTLSGLVANLSQYPQNQQKKIIGVAVLKNADYLKAQIRQWLEAFNADNQTQDSIDWQLLTQYHAGGYAKTRKSLDQLGKRFQKAFKIPLEPIYNQKMLNGVYQELKQGHIPPNAKVLLLHTGGLQANES